MSILLTQYWIFKFFVHRLVFLQLKNAAKEKKKKMQQLVEQLTSMAFEQ